ncbi:hypothetical protein JTE90_006546 [Oedothorax gibbosus]|uniref:Flavin-containing monooxygenase n=1 Tax=Oedothorax gibbosus TaxID=931172 RepID=A0AAV6VLT1_9ARAC|nr:hypothetical protein JTE90_006546 [Oedothorax gibbosus]
MEPVCFEQTDKIGGTWNYREESVDGVPSIMASTHINISKELTAVSTFPPKKECNNFMKHDELFQYCMEYANKHDAVRHIRCNSEVTKVRKSKDYDVTGKWDVMVKDKLTGAETTEYFDGVMVCIGHVNRPKMPTFPEQEAFKGTIMHTHSLKRVNEFENKTVVVVGTGCSGVDAAVESSNVAKQVYLSTRSGAHIMKRVATNGYPFDSILARRWLFFLLQILPIKFSSWLVESVFLDSLFDHRLYAVKPKKPFLCQDPSVSDGIYTKLHTGSVIQKPDIERFTGNGVVFKGETSETKADVVIMATGYSWKFPFLEDGIIVQEGKKINLYKCAFPTHLQKATLAIVSFILPFGPGFPLCELQIRWIVQVLLGKLKLPSTKLMLKDVEDRYSTNLNRYEYDDKMSLRVDYLPYMDDISSLLGVKPNLLKYFFTDFKLFVKLLFGPVLAYQYRLTGPHRWEGAREAIMTSDARMHWPLQKRKEPKESLLMIIIKKILRLLLLY